ncbi:MAG: hypothetical protein NC395_00910 [Prevotella sp.]|nr:hypothetical protein [Prevotella sp.]
MVELIIVLAIIAILSGTMSIVVNGFQRDARMETDNNKARLVYTGFQSALLQCEITQNDSVINASKILTASSISDANTNRRLTYSIIRFTMANGSISGNIAVNSYYDNSASYQSAVNVTNGSKQFKELEDVIYGFVDNTFEGTVTVYLDVDNYAVDSVLYFEREADYTSYVSSGWVSLLSKYTYDSNGGSKGKIFQAVESTTEQKTLIKNRGVYCGSYPVMEQGSGGYYKAS